MKKLTGKTAIITGASSGIGRATALRFAEEGCNLVLTARRTERLEEVCRACGELGAKAVYYAGDAMLEQTAIETVKLTVETFGQIDILINNAGIGRVQPIQGSNMADYDLIMNSNVRSAFAFTLHTVPEMMKREVGQIVMVSSVTGIYGHINEAAYSASKFALRGLAQAVDHDLHGKGIKSCVYCPGCSITEFEVGYGRTKERIEASGKLTAEDSADALLFICTRSAGARVSELHLVSLKDPIF